MAASFQRYAFGQRCANRRNIDVGRLRPVITKKPESAYSFAVYEAMKK